MKKTKNEENISAHGSKQGTDEIVEPIVACVEANASITNELVERTLHKIQTVEDLIDIIARQIKRAEDEKE